MNPGTQAPRVRNYGHQGPELIGGELWPLGHNLGDPTQYLTPAQRLALANGSPDDAAYAVVNRGAAFLDGLIVNWAGRLDMEDFGLDDDSANGPFSQLFGREPNDRIDRLTGDAIYLNDYGWCADESTPDKVVTAWREAIAERLAKAPASA